MADTLKANIYLFCMGVVLYVLSLVAQGAQAHQWATTLQQGTYFCIGGIALLFVWRVAIILGSSRFNRQRGAWPAAKTMPIRRRRAA